MIQVIDLDLIAGILMTFYILYQLVVGIHYRVFCKSDCELTSSHQWHAISLAQVHPTRASKL